MDMTPDNRYLSSCDVTCDTLVTRNTMQCIPGNLIPLSEISLVHGTHQASAGVSFRGIITQIFLRKEKNTTLVHKSNTNQNPNNSIGTDTILLMGFLKRSNDV